MGGNIMVEIRTNVLYLGMSGFEDVEFNVGDFSVS